MHTSPTHPTPGMHRPQATPDPARRPPAERAVRLGIWWYFVLWLIEGGLRRWILPGLATPLLVVRDPIVLWIYYQASKAAWPRSQFIPVAAVLAIVSWGFAVAAGHGNPIVAAYGVRCDFLHLPLMFIIGNYLNRDDLDKVCRTALWIAAPYTLLLILQFYSPQSAWINRGVGGDLEGAGFSGALGRFRPPGTFSFIIGVSQLYPMLAGAWFYLQSGRKMGVLLTTISGLAIVLAIPFSISRSLFVGVLVVAVAGAYSLVVSGALASKSLFQIVFGGVGILLAASLLPATSDAVDAFSHRWERSTTDRGGVESAIVDRVLNDLASPFTEAPFLGYGTGISTQVGQKLLTGQRGFGFSEGEWGRILFEGGLLLGCIVLAYRIALIVFVTSQAFLGGPGVVPAAIPLWAAAFPLLLIGQWGQSTTLGSTVIATGLCLAAAATQRGKY